MDRIIAVRLALFEVANNLAHKISLACMHEVQQRDALEVMYRCPVLSISNLSNENSASPI